MLADQATIQKSQPNFLIFEALRAIEDMVGRDVLIYILVKAGLTHITHAYPTDTNYTGISFDKFPLIMQAMEKQFGEKAGRKIAYRAGKMMFPDIIKRYEKSVDFSKNTINLIPLRNRLSIVLGVLVDISDQIVDQKLSLDEDQHHYFIRTDQCVACWERSHATTPVCDMCVGFFEAGICWLCDGMNYRVKEIACKAIGDDACVFSVSKSLL